MIKSVDMVGWAHGRMVQLTDVDTLYPEGPVAVKVMPPLYAVFLGNVIWPVTELKRQPVGNVVIAGVMDQTMVPVRVAFCVRAGAVV